MRSIDKLLEWAERNASTGGMDEIDEIVDEIEREVEELRDRDYRNGREDAEGAVEFADRLKAAVDNREDVTLWGVDYTPLPVDADGVPIHVGDVVVEDGCGVPYKVMSLTLFEDCWDVGECGMNPNLCHHAPTVEDVLREFAYGLGVPVADSYVAATAAKLRLACDE